MTSSFNIKAWYWIAMTNSTDADRLQNVGDKFNNACRKPWECLRSEMTLDRFR
jgi:hypothetical protein